jgi:molybdopterin-guanine dinucleotide biosynthesis protein A
LDVSAIILAGGSSSRFGQDKGLLHLANKPLIEHVLAKVKDIVDERIVVVSSDSQSKNYSQALGSAVHVLIDADKMRTPLVGALTGFKVAQGEYSLLLSCDVPFVSTKVLSLMLDLCADKAAVITRWPNGYIEPLQAVYCTKPALEAAENVLGNGELKMQAMVDRLRGIRYISTLVLQQLDPELETFFNVNTSLDLRKAEKMIRTGGR